ncbi:hypothetical protein AOQ71_28065 [Bradyrhizobium manausense]|uniref:Uncharacterized protein n=1 Tax=Bradyrhizobium manausense TaxID=989370 RepID=A0A0R3D6E0_9BRAD|nr:hypothetical protein AOQ71_28065 [Bradyrhizobium manausense]
MSKRARSGLCCILSDRMLQPSLTPGEVYRKFARSAVTRNSYLQSQGEMQSLGLARDSVFFT